MGRNINEATTVFAFRENNNTVDGGTGWYAGDYAPYYWSDWNDWNGFSAPPIFGNGPGSNPGSPQQGGFRGDK